MVFSNKVKTDNGSFEVETEVIQPLTQTESLKTTHTVIIAGRECGSTGISILHLTREELLEIRNTIARALDIVR